MKGSIRRISAEDKKEVFAMMQEFYSSPAVHTDGSKEIFEADINACLQNSPYLEGYVFEGEDKTVWGYAMVAKSFSTEFGKPCVWIEDIYLKKEYRGLGVGGSFIGFVRDKFPDAVIRLEAEEENSRAVAVYQKNGFERLSYLEMIKF